MSGMASPLSLPRQDVPSWARRCWRALACAALLLVAAAQAAEPPEVEHYGTVEYVSGEIGLDESDVVAATHYNLGLTFASKGGEYLGEVHVRVTDGRDAIVLEADTQGPRLLTRLPPGRYRIAATFASRTLTREAEVADHPRTELEFRWPLDASVASLAPPAARRGAR